MANNIRIHEQHELNPFIEIDGFNYLIQTILKISAEQFCKKVIIWVILKHLVLCRDPTLHEIETFLLDVKLEHLEGLHHEGTNTIPPFGICFRTRREDTFTWNGRSLYREVVHGN